MARIFLGRAKGRGKKKKKKEKSLCLLRFLIFSVESSRRQWILRGEKGKPNICFDFSVERQMGPNSSDRVRKRLWSFKSDKVETWSALIV